MCSNVYIYIDILSTKVAKDDSSGDLSKTKTGFVLVPPLLINHGQDACTSWLHALVDVTSPLPTKSVVSGEHFASGCPKPCHGTSLVTELTAILS